MNAITFIYFYMKRRKQGVKINDTESLFKIFYQERLKDPSKVRFCSKYLLKIFCSLQMKQNSQTLLMIIQSTQRKVT